MVLTPQAAAAAAAAAAAEGPSGPDGGPLPPPGRRVFRFDRAFGGASTQAEVFAEALRLLISDPRQRGALAEGSRRAGERLTGWDTTAALIGEALNQVG